MEKRFRCDHTLVNGGVSEAGPPGVGGRLDEYEED